MEGPAAKAPAAEAPAAKVKSRPGAVPGGRPGQGSFVRAHGTSFVDDDCREVFPTGWNGCAGELSLPGRTGSYFWDLHSSRKWPLLVNKSKIP